MNLDTYFSTVWKPNTDRYIYSGWQLLSKVLPTDKVLDVGCGYNLFKSSLGDRLIGIDPYNLAADITVGIDEFTTHETFDVIFCLGSINFGNEETILRQTKKVVELCRPGGSIYWRQNPGRKDHGNTECKDIDFFDWSFDKNIKYASIYNCNVNMLALDSGNRIYAEWNKR